MQPVVLSGRGGGDHTSDVGVSQQGYGNRAGGADLCQGEVTKNRALGYETTCPPGPDVLNGPSVTFWLVVTVQVEAPVA